MRGRLSGVHPIIPDQAYSNPFPETASEPRSDSLSRSESDGASHPPGTRRQNAEMAADASWGLKSPSSTRYAVSDDGSRARDTPSTTDPSGLDALLSVALEGGSYTE